MFLGLPLGVWMVLIVAALIAVVRMHGRRTHTGLEEVYHILMEKKCWQMRVHKSWMESCSMETSVSIWSRGLNIHYQAGYLDWDIHNMPPVLSERIAFTESGETMPLVLLGGEFGIHTLVRRGKKIDVASCTPQEVEYIRYIIEFVRSKEYVARTLEDL